MYQNRNFKRKWKTTQTEEMEGAGDQRNKNKKFKRAREVSFKLFSRDPKSGLNIAEEKISRRENQIRLSHRIRHSRDSCSAL